MIVLHYYYQVPVPTLNIILILLFSVVVPVLFKPYVPAAMFAIYKNKNGKIKPPK